MSRGRRAQWVRRAIQFGSLGFVVYTALAVLWRNYKWAHNSSHVVELTYGPVVAFFYRWHDWLLSWFGESFTVSLKFLGMPWAATVAGVPTADPILVASALANGVFRWSLLVGLLLPLAVALVAGKFFCSHLCPARLLFELGQGVRAGLRRLGLTLPFVRSDLRLGGWILVGGLAAAALVGTGVWVLLLPYLSLGSGIFLSITTGSLSGLLLLAVGLVAFDLLVAPGYVCHNLCPTGWLLEWPARIAWIRLRKRPDAKPCPESCRICTAVCPYHLEPKFERHWPACNNCGACAADCPLGVLGRAPRPRIGRPLAAVALVGLLLAASPAAAHHNKGLPHYGYFENYPQVPVEEYVEVVGRWEFGATIFNFQGLERRTSTTPNDVKIYAYVYDTEAGRNYDGPVTFEIWLGDRLVTTYRRLRPDEEYVYVGRETLPESGTYRLVARMGGGEPLAITFDVDLAEDRVDWGLIGGILAGLAALFALALYGRRQRLRAEVAAVALALLWLGGSEVAAQELASLAPSLVTSEVVLHRSHHGDVADHGGAPDAAMKKMAPGPEGGRSGHGARMAGHGDHGAHRMLRDESGAQVMVMRGVPRWLFLLGVAGILVVSFVVVERRGVGVRRWRHNLVADRRRFLVLRKRRFQSWLQAGMLLVFLAILYVGLAGNRIGNIVPVLVWTIWWSGLIFAIAFLGPVWCSVCPWDAAANLVTRFGLRRRVEPLTLGLEVPRWLRNVYPALGLFVLLTWLELGWGVTTDPRATAYMGLAMVTLAIAGALLFERKAFCAYGCPVGRINGIYANVSPIELRPRNPKTCTRCTTEECYHGNERGYPCPTGISLKTIADATHCTFCMECVRSCDKYNVAINLRPVAADVDGRRIPRFDEAWLAVALLALTLFHGVTMTDVWESFQPGVPSFLKWARTTLGLSRVEAFTVGMLLFNGLLVGLYLAASWASAVLARLPGRDWRWYFRAFAYTLLPVALFYHMAHNGMHLAMEAGHVVPRLGDPIGTGANWLGLRDVHVGPLLPMPYVWWGQVLLILVGHVLGIVVAHRVGRATHDDPRVARRVLIPLFVVMILVSVCGMWLMHLDMNMRVGRM